MGECRNAGAETAPQASVETGSGPVLDKAARPGLLTRKSFPLVHNNPGGGLCPTLSKKYARSGP
jgi:hypothetical protein